MNSLFTRISLGVLAASIFAMSSLASAQPNKRNSLPADDHTMMRFMKVYNPPIYSNSDLLRLPKLTADLSSKKVILVGELHDQFEQHIAQLGVLKSLHENNPKLGIGVEWIQSSFQPVVDDFMAGRIDELTFIKETRFMERWGYDYRMFRPILSYAKRHNIPLFALNAPQEVTDKISDNGLESLSAEEKAAIAPKIHPPSEDNLMELEEHFTRYVSDPDKIERMITVKRVWDETMTHNTLKALNQPNINQMVVFAGVNHVINETGIASDLARELNRDDIATISTQTKEEMDKAVTDYVIQSPLLYVAN